MGDEARFRANFRVEFDISHSAVEHDLAGRQHEHEALKGRNARGIRSIGNLSQLNTIEHEEMGGCFEEIALRTQHIGAGTRRNQHIAARKKGGWTVGDNILQAIDHREIWARFPRLRHGVVHGGVPSGADGKNSAVRTQQLGSNFTNPTPVRVGGIELDDRASGTDPAAEPRPVNLRIRQITKIIDVDGQHLSIGQEGPSLLAIAIRLAAACAQLRLAGLKSACP